MQGDGQAGEQLGQVDLGNIAIIADVIIQELVLRLPRCRRLPQQDNPDRLVGKLFAEFAYQRETALTLLTRHIYNHDGDIRMRLQHVRRHVCVLRDQEDNGHMAEDKGIE